MTQNQTPQPATDLVAYLQPRLEAVPLPQDLIDQVNRSTESLLEIKSVSSDAELAMAKEAIKTARKHSFLPLDKIRGDVKKLFDATIYDPIADPLKRFTEAQKGLQFLCDNEATRQAAIAKQKQVELERLRIEAERKIREAEEEAARKLQAVDMMEEGSVTDGLLTLLGEALDYLKPDVTAEPEPVLSVSDLSALASAQAPTSTVKTIKAVEIVDVDFNEVPVQYLLLDERKVRADILAGKAIPGVTAKISEKLDLR